MTITPGMMMVSGILLLATLSPARAQQMPQAQTPAVTAAEMMPASVDPPGTSSTNSIASTNSATSTNASSSTNALPTVGTTNPASQDEASSENVYKNMSLQQLMDQQVTLVSRTPESYADTPAAINVITNEQILRSGANSLPEALRLADNLDVAQDNAHDWNISARGFNAGLGNKMLVLIDGRTVYSPLFSGVIWDVQNVMLQDVDRIEVVSGPGGSLWGANAVNGIISVVSKSAEDTQGWYVDGGGGSQWRDFGSIRYGGTLAPNVYYRVYGTYFDHNNEVYSSGEPANDAWSQGMGGFRVDTGSGTDDKLMFQGEYYNGAAEDASMPGTDTDSGGHFLGKWTHTFAPDSDMSLQVYYDRTNYKEPAAGVGLNSPGFFSDDLDTADVDFQHNFSAGDRNMITWGLGYRFTHDVDGNAPALEVLPATLDQNLYSAFIQDEIKILDNLHFTFGTKVEHNDYTGFEFQPSARLQWDVARNNMIWAAVSRPVRTPSRLDRDLYEPTGYPPGPIFKGLPYTFPQSVLDGTTGFESEDLIAYELGYRAQVTSEISCSLSTFYNDYSDIRSTTPGPATSFSLPILLQNNLEGQTYGLELSTDYQMLSWWRWHAGYDYLKENIHVKPGETDFTNGLNETADPKNQVFLRSSMDLPNNIDFDLNGRFIDSLTINNGPTAATVPGYFELDARLAWRPIKNMEVSVVGQNLLHDQHAEYGFPGPNQVQIERSVYGKISWEF